MVPGILLKSFDIFNCNFRLDGCLFVVEGLAIKSLWIEDQHMEMDMDVYYMDMDMDVYYMDMDGYGCVLDDGYGCI